MKQEDTAASPLFLPGVPSLQGPPSPRVVPNRFGSSFCPLDLIEAAERAPTTISLVRLDLNLPFTTREGRSEEGEGRGCWGVATAFCGLPGLARPSIERADGRAGCSIEIHIMDDSKRVPRIPVSQSSGLDIPCWASLLPSLCARDTTARRYRPNPH